jgi:septum formation protein
MGKNQPLTLPYPLILASTSKYRGALLAQLGWTFEAMAPGVDEDEVKSQGLAPSSVAMTLALLKAQAVFQRRPDACVIGSDQVCALDGKIFSKPGNRDAAVAQLLELSGRPHELLTAVAVLAPGKSETFLNRTILQMRHLSRAAVEAYVDADLPLDCAGSYKLEVRGIRLFENIEMDDHTAVIGLPLIKLTTTLINLGYPL